jgi:glycosyltransferase involved in cell wall biosynthesis
MNKVTYIISDINKSVFFEHTATLLKEKNTSISFVLINSKGSALDIFLIENNFEVNYLNVKNIKNSFSAIRKCASILKQNKTKILHCHLGTANWVGLWAGKIAGIKKRIFTRHAGEPLFYSKKEKLIDNIQNWLSTDIVSISKNITGVLKKQGVKEQKIHLIHHGFDLDRFTKPNLTEVERLKNKYNPSKQFPVIGVIARWMEWKGIQYTIKSFQLLLIEYPNAKLLLFNYSENGDYSNKLNMLLENLPENSYEKIKFEDNIYDLYQLFDVYVHVPINLTCEAFGQTYVEALAAGIPSIFTLSGIAPEFIRDNQNALVVPFENADAIHLALLKLIENKKLAFCITENGKSDVQKHFGLDKMVNKLEFLYLN